MATRSKDNLKKISELCEYLSDRDILMKEENVLMKNIFDSLPIKIIALRVNKDFKITNHISNIQKVDYKQLSENEAFLNSCKKALTNNQDIAKIDLAGHTFECVNKRIKEADDIEAIISVAWAG